MTSGSGESGLHFLGMELERNSDGPILIKNENAIEILYKEFAGSWPELFKGCTFDSPMREERLTQIKPHEDIVPEEDFAY